MSKTVTCIFSPGMGLGNSLFVIASGIYYCENHHYKLQIVKENPALFGTSCKFDKHVCYTINGKDIPYTDTIFSKLKVIDSIDDSTEKIYNNYTNNININPSDHIIISGLNQNLELFNSVTDAIPKYLNFDDMHIKNYILEKYGNIENSTCIGVRRGSDFSHMTKLTKTSYQKAIDYLNNKQQSNTFYVISDTPTSNFFNGITESLIEVNEPDIIQIYFGLMCRNYVLSESTFHLWIAYLGTAFGKNLDKTVVCYNDTDITSRNLNLNNWIKIDY